MGDPDVDGALGAMYLAACLYYLEDRSQREIAERLQVSRSTVSRLLTEARRTGLVEITVRPLRVPGELAGEVADALGVREVLLAPSERETLAVAGLAGSALARAGLAPGSVLLASWGRTMWQVAQQRLPATPGVVVVPAVGGSNQPQEYFQSNEIARRIAVTMQGTHRSLHAPYNPGPTLWAALMEDRETAETLALWDRTSLALFGIGAPPRELGDYGPAPVPRHEQLLERAVGDVATRYFDADGCPVHFPGDDQFLAVSHDQLARVPTKIAAAAGTAKVPSIRGAARAGFVDVLLTDVGTARQLVGR
ncbi:MAG TPA: sugar-binding domain-containing protein [Egibacteraceae bacterium]|nr:sugar-binding domain-containing protein [Egibacteraceae bacterium]